MSAKNTKVNLHGLASKRLTSISDAMIPKLEIQSISQLLQQFTRQQESLRASFGLLEDFRLAHQLDYAIPRMSELLALEQQFILPDITDTLNLMAEVNKQNQFALAGLFQEKWMDDLKGQIRSLQHPWFDVKNQTESISSLAELHGIGHALSNTAAFDPALTDELRFDLGDWRGNITWPAEIAVDPLARISFYEERGLDSTLTAFPYPAFEEILSTSGLTTTDVPIADEYNRITEDEDGQSDFERTNRAHDLIQRFETQIRKYVDEAMDINIGPHWITHRVPEDMRLQWLRKRESALASGEQEWPLIVYADFSDYIKIIARRDNWRDVFERIFTRKADIQESFRRLYPIRICTMHSRPITQDDELLLHVETKRILSAIGNEFHV